MNDSFKRVFKRSLKVLLRHISLWKGCKVFDWRRNLSLRRGLSVLVGGAFERLFLPWGEGIWTSQSWKVQMPGGLPGGDVELSNWSAHNFVVCTNSSGNRLSFGCKNLQRNVKERKGPQTRKSCSRVFDFSIYFFRSHLLSQAIARIINFSRNNLPLLGFYRRIIEWNKILYGNFAKAEGDVLLK